MNQAFNQVNNMPIQNNQVKTILFEDSVGNKININLPISFTVGQAIEKYFERCPQFNLIKNKIFFLYCSSKINERDKTKKINDFFQDFRPKVLVFDSKNIIGG